MHTRKYPVAVAALGLGLLLLLGGCGGQGSTGASGPGSSQALKVLSPKVVLAPQRNNNVVADFTPEKDGTFVVTMESLTQGMRAIAQTLSAQKGKTQRLVIKVEAGSAPEGTKQTAKLVVKDASGSTVASSDVEVEVAPALVWVVDLKRNNYSTACGDYPYITPNAVVPYKDVVYTVGTLSQGAIYNQPCPQDGAQQAFAIQLQKLGGSPNFGRQWGSTDPTGTFAIDAVVDAGGTLYIAGGTNSNMYGNGSFSGEVIRITANNTRTSLASFPGKLATRIAQNSDENAFYLALWAYDPDTYDNILSVAKVDLSGRTLWETEIARSSAQMGGGFVMPTALFEVDGTLVLTYATMAYGSGYGAKNYAVKLDPADGAVKGSFSLSDTGLLAASPGPDGFYVAGYVRESLANPLQGEQDPYVAYFRLDGTRVWHKQDGVDEGSNYPNLQEVALPATDPWGYLYVIGLRGGQPFQAKYTPQGEELYTSPLPQNVSFGLGETTLALGRVAAWDPEGVYLISPKDGMVYRMAP